MVCLCWSQHVSAQRRKLNATVRKWCHSCKNESVIDNTCGESVYSSQEEKYLQTQAALFQISNMFSIK